MQRKWSYEELKELLDTHKNADKAWFLSLLDDENQREYEEERLQAVMQMMSLVRIRPHKRKVALAKAEIAQIEERGNPSAEDYVRIRELMEIIEEETRKIDEYRCFFEEPYFARMDLVDNAEGYNSYYIGKKGDIKLEIVDWRAPVARRYYQKSCAAFTFNEYSYKTILRRALQTQNGKLLAFKNEFLSLKEYLSEDEIGGRDEDNILDPFLREIIRSRKEEASVKDIIRTIQEKQYEIITCPERTNFVLQGCAGSGKTMVMLHRLSYLMYNNDNIRTHDVLIITPSNSFNTFINELATVLELERVKTLTVYEYFLQVLKNEKIDLADKIDLGQKEAESYLSYVYSEAFPRDLKKKTEKVYDSLYGLFTGEECQDFISDIVEDCREQIAAYEGIKNASLRVRRTVLGEIKERKEGGIYYTKAFRSLMNCILDIDDFFEGTLHSERAKNPDYFYRQLLSFYKSATFAVRKAESVVTEAIEGLAELKEALQKEIFDLKRFRQKIGGVEKYLYADRIERREELLKETEKITEKVVKIGERGTAFSEFYEYLRGEKTFFAIGSGNGFIDIVRYFYRETVKKYKLKHGMKSSKMYASDAYAVCLICQLLGRRLSPAHSYVFVDEAQDISAGEYALLRAINQNAAFNMFGDTEQNITPYRGVKNWREVFAGFELYSLNQNYRNTNQIVDFVAETLEVDMKSIGYDGPEVQRIGARGISGFFKDKKGLKAVICAEEDKALYARKAYSVLSEKGQISRSKINLMTVYESKGLEFSSVVVVPDHMTANERYIAYTRALQYLAVVQTGEKK
ncbi:MAG: AAA family ATPase [Clostridia bacterium]|nr:AAA family ATPase [Clostridia bacterium]